MKLKMSFVAIFCVVVNVFAQSYSITYSKERQRDNSVLEGLPEDLKEKLKSMQKSYMLGIDKDKSIFKELPSSPQNVFSENGKEKVSRTITIKTNKYDIYKDLKSNSFHIETELDNQEYSIIGKLPNISWKTTNDTDTILGYKVKKAEGVYKNKPVIVWYAEQIPVKDGPHFYRGVNGLVLKVELDKETYIATNIEKGGNEKINIPNSKDTISLEEYDKKKEEFINKLRGGSAPTNGATVIKTQTIKL